MLEELKMLKDLFVGLSQEIGFDIFGKIGDEIFFRLEVGSFENGSFLANIIIHL